MAITTQDASNKSQAQFQAQVVEKVILNGDLSGFKPSEKLVYIEKLCHSLELNPLTKPFQLIRFQGQEKLYATKDCTEQLRKLNNVSLTIKGSKIVDDVYVVTVSAQTPDGRIDESTGAVPLPSSLKGEARCNAIMKAETKGKRRVTLSICGLGVLDESETDTISDVKFVDIEKEKNNEEQAHQLLENIQMANSKEELQMAYEKAKEFARSMQDISLSETFKETTLQRKSLLEQTALPIDDQMAEEFVNEMDGENNATVQN